MIVHPWNRALRRVLRPALFFWTATALFAQPSPVPPDEIDPGGTIDFTRTVVLFYSDACSHCHREMRFLDSIKDDFPDLSFVQIEVDQSGNAANEAFFTSIMERLDSYPSSWPRTVVGGRVFIGYNEESGPLQWIESYRAWAGYENQLLRAIEELNASLEGAATAPPPAVDPAGTWRRLRWTAAVASLALLLYTVVAVFAGRRAEQSARRLWVGGGILLLVISLFAVATAVPAGEIAGRAEAWPFPLTVTLIALLDGFNPCAFTVLFILLSLLTHARRRRDMALVGGVFVIASGVVYVAFILAMVAVGSFALSALGTWVLRAVGAVVLVMGVLSLVESIRGTSAPVTTLSQNQKASLGTRAGVAVRRFVEADTTGKRIAGLGGVVVLAVVVNGVELGCTAILPAVYMSALLTRYGTNLGGVHVAWTAWYGLVYVLPMVAIVADFAVTFRSRRVSETHGRRLKTAVAGVMVLFGGVLIAAPQALLLL